MKKLANGSSSKDSKLGPGAYNVQDDMLRTSPKVGLTKLKILEQH
jgi:hypothetical protein